MLSVIACIFQVFVSSMPNMGLKLMIPRSRTACSTEPTRGPRTFQFNGLLPWGLGLPTCNSEGPGALSKEWVYAWPFLAPRHRLALLVLWLSALRPLLQDALPDPGAGVRLPSGLSQPPGLLALVITAWLSSLGG